MNKLIREIVVRCESVDGPEENDEKILRCIHDVDQPGDNALERESQEGNDLRLHNDILKRVSEMLYGLVQSGDFARIVIEEGPNDGKSATIELCEELDWS